jgi:hypothetical protein
MGNGHLGWGKNQFFQNGIHQQANPTPIPAFPIEADQMDRILN